MLKAGSSLLCGLFVLLTLYVLLTLSGCSVMMAMVGDKEPDFEHIKVGATKEEIDFEFNQPGTPKELGEGKTEVTYKYEMGNSPNAARAAIYGYYDLATLGFAEPVFTVVEFFVGHKEQTSIVYGADNKALSISGYTPPPLSPEMKAAIEEQEKHVRKRPTPRSDQPPLQDSTSSQHSSGSP
ncbi:MAG: hypothetical protein A4C66_14310 [Nitrospira sp. HN-bin3]|uniref:hypothetical protein n=1 Tax=Nitrospira cf. moscoviensis SBR1015 TaxID=96242 RepID=UPI000A0DDDD8|nr:hypothetical protein [Nitrospira cf. moscoviensis SBR1015]OQW49416.1 MAG: hypothetical protein A4C66_14310 [Nitrospira sp. HN-bin3]